MRRCRATLVLVVLVIACMSLPALARKGGGSGGSGGRGSHASSGSHTHARSSGSFSSYRYFAGRPRVGVFLGAPVFAVPYFYPAGAYAAPPPPMEYIERPPDPDVWYFCPESGGYYPHVQQCPGGLEQVAPYPPATGGWSPPNPAY